MNKRLYIVVDIMLSKIVKEEPIYDKIAGIVYGAAIGNCLGYPVKGWTRDSIETKKVSGMPFPDRVIRDIRGDDWADSVDHMLIVMINLINGGGKIGGVRLITSLCRWRDHGFPELGDKKGNGISLHLSDVLKKFDDAAKVMESAKQRRLLFGKEDKPHPNCALVRSALCCVTPGWIKNSILQTIVTHYSTFCSFGSWLLNYLLRCCLRGDPIDFEYIHKQKIEMIAYYEVKIIDIYLEKYQKIVETTEHKMDENGTSVELLEYLAELQIDNVDKKTSQVDIRLGLADKKSSVLTALGCAFYAIAVSKLNGAPDEIFKKYMFLLANEGGDTDINCAIAGQILGACFGLSKLPADCIQHLAARRVLDDITYKFISSISKFR